MNSEGVLEKIRALLALAASDSGATEAEASLAAERASALLLKHNLDMTDIGEAVDEGQVIEDTFESGGFKWRGSLVNVVAQGNFCQVLLINGKPTIMGRSDNVAVVKELSGWLIGQMEMLVAADEFAREVRGELTPNWRESFLYGTVNRVGERLQAAKAANENMTDNSMAVVIMLDEESSDYMHDKYRNIQHGGYHHPLDGTAYRAGVQAGHRVSILPGSKQIRS